MWIGNETNGERNLEMNRKGDRGFRKRGNGLGKWEAGMGDKCMGARNGETELSKKS
jgi:hypothetical protein